MGDMLLELLKGSAQSLLEAVVAQIHGEIFLVWGFKDDFKAFQKKLRGLNGLLSRAGSKLGSGSSTSENELLKDWLEQVGEVAYRAEDVVDEYAYELLKRKLALRDMEGMKPMLRLKTKARFFCFSCSSNPLLLRFRMAHKVKSLGESIAEVYGEAQRLGIRPIDVAAGVGAGSSSTLAGAEKDLRLELRREQADCWDLVGRDHDKAQIMEWLLQASKSDKLLNVIGIHGMAGLGKTTLCRRIYETEEVKEWFKE